MHRSIQINARVRAHTHTHTHRHRHAHKYDMHITSFPECQPTTPVLSPPTHLSHQPPLYQGESSRPALSRLTTCLRGQPELWGESQPGAERHWVGQGGYLRRGQSYNMEVVVDRKKGGRRSYHAYRQRDAPSHYTGRALQSPTALPMAL